MQASTNFERTNLSNAKALRRSREMLKVTRNDLARRLGMSHKTVEKYENGRAILDQGKMESVLGALNLDREVFKKIKKGKGTGLLRRKKTVLCNSQRRSYRRVITKELRVLKVMRHMKKLPQDKASAVCGYSRPTIGHIENGRMEISLKRISHIVSCYSMEMKDFERLMKEEVLRDEMIETCVQKLREMPEEKLKVAGAVIENLV